MKNLRDQLLKAGLVGKKDAKKAQAEQLRERKEKGIKHSTAQSEAEQRRAELHAEKQDEQRRRDQEREAERAAERRARDDVFRIRDIIAGAAVRLRPGDRRWYFVCPDQRLRYVLVQDSAARELEGGDLAIVNDPTELQVGSTWRIVPRATALKLRVEAPAVLLFFNGPE